MQINYDDYTSLPAKLIEELKNTRDDALFADPLRDSGGETKWLTKIQYMDALTKRNTYFCKKLP